jgi:glucuronate isomerase
MSLELRKRIFAQLDSLVLVDPHTHINALNPSSQTLADILGYHYYTELAHSAGMPKDQIEAPELDPKEKVRRLIERMGPIDNTIQYSWFVEMCQAFFGFEEQRITLDNWEPLYDRAAAIMSAPDWTQQVMAKSRLEAVFLTNDFDDPLEGFDTNVFIPCLRTDDLVFHLSKQSVQQRLADATGVEVTNADTLRYAIGGLFHYFKERNARACAISLPPDFAPQPISDARADTAIAELYRKGPAAHESQRKAAANFVFRTLAQYCAEYRLPFDLMIGVNRSVYPGGVYQGMDLYDSRVSLIEYKELFNAFPQVNFPISVLASVTNQELVSYSWIFPNVIANGHWWYSNTPAYIEHDCAARLEAIPRTKQIGYYSDMYKMEFALPKFAMYKRILAKVLAERFVIERGWGEDEAIALGTQILRGNVLDIFAATPMPEYPEPEAVEEGYYEPAPETEPFPDAETPQLSDLAIPAAAAAVATSIEEETAEPTDWNLPGEEEAVSVSEAVATDEVEAATDDLAFAPAENVELSDVEEVDLASVEDIDLNLSSETPAESPPEANLDDLAALRLDDPLPVPAEPSLEEPLAPAEEAPIDLGADLTIDAEEIVEVDEFTFEPEPDSKRTN